MIIVTGGAGFIGSAIVWQLNQRNVEDILIVDELGSSEKWKNLVNLKFSDYVEKNLFIDDVLHGRYNDEKIDVIFHMGACSSTQETDASYLIENNYEYTKILVEFAKTQKIKIVYASSAATYGDGNNGYSDKSIEHLAPMNMYGYSKQLVDNWISKKGYFKVGAACIGVKFFNVYGPNENHKDEMKSMINKAYSQIKDTGKIKLFKSYNPQYADGEQMRDFIYVKDAVNLVFKLLERNKSGIFNIGTGVANSWNTLAKAIFKAMGKKEHIEYIEMPEILRDKYQYFTEAEMKKTLDMVGKYEFQTLEDAVKDYVQNYLEKNAYLGNES